MRQRTVGRAAKHRQRAIDKAYHSVLPQCAEIFFIKHRAAARGYHCAALDRRRGDRLAFQCAKAGLAPLGKDRRDLTPCGGYYPLVGIDKPPPGQLGYPPPYTAFAAGWHADKHYILLAAPHLAPHAVDIGGVCLPPQKERGGVDRLCRQHVKPALGRYAACACLKHRQGAKGIVYHIRHTAKAGKA